MAYDQDRPARPGELADAGQGEQAAVARPAVDRRTVLRGLGVAGAGAGAVVAGLGGYAPPAFAERTTHSSIGRPSGSGEITAAGVARALRALPSVIERGRATSSVPGVAVAVVYRGAVRYLAGHGKREVGKDGRVNPDTVFQLASVSKPISSTVIAAVLTRRLAEVSWDDTVQSLLPGFTLSDPWVGEHVTVADLLSHRSGLPDHAGDLLEDLGYTGEQIIAKLAQYPLAPFRSQWIYTNYGFTAGVEAIARATGRRWPVLARELVFGPLGMTRSSFSFAELQQRRNRAALHREVDGQWVPDLDADYDGEAPAGGASASVRDMAKWVKMLLAEGRRVTDEEQLQRIWHPAIVRPGVPPIGGRASFYGLGWNLDYEDTGELRVGHSGAFGKGASTSVTAVPSEELAIVALTNGEPRGLPEAISAEFLDIVRLGRSSRDWLAFIGPRVVPPPTADQTRYSTPASNPPPPRALADYVGTYENRLYGDLHVSLRNGALSFTVGPAGLQFPLLHYSGDEFYFQTTGENASGFSGALFAGQPQRVASVTINAWDADELGTFTRPSR